MIGRYQIKAELGRGGMSTVYLAHDPRFERDVAVKLLPHELLHHPTFRRRFEREAKVVAALDHPAIVPVYDFGDEDGQPFLVMRHMHGGSLADWLKKGPISASEAARIMVRLAPALDEVHAHGVVHRDLKPSNILFDQRGAPFISDFGTAKVAYAHTKLTETGGAVGTPAYMSPEQIQGDTKLDGRSDLYTLGVILFEMLTGKHPYQTDTPIGMAVKHIFEPVPRILDIQPGLPPGCQAIIARSMAKNRQERYPTAIAFATALARVAQKLDPGGHLAVELAHALPLQEELVIGRRLALIIGNDHYDDPILSQLIRPAADAPELARLLQDPEIGHFDEVILLVNEPTHVIRRAISRFFADKNCDDSLLLYLSGHAVLDGRNQLYLTGKNTEHDLLRGTAILAVFIADEMDNSEAKQQILVLDCHHSHASVKDLPSRVGKAVDTGSSFARYGRERVILTANDTTHYIWGENGIIGYAENSRFTHYLIQGLATGAADANNDGKITIDELFDYVCDQLATQEVEIQQVPRKWSYNEQSEIVVAQNSHLSSPGPAAQIELAEAASKPATAKGPESSWSQPEITTQPAKAFVPLMALGVILLLALSIARFLPAAGDAQTKLPNAGVLAPATITMIATETMAERALTTPALGSATVAQAATATLTPTPTQADTTTATDVPANRYLAMARLPSTIFTEPNTTSEELTFVDAGDQVVVLGRSTIGHWLYVRSADDIEGYIHRPRLEWGGDFASLPAVAPRILATAATMPASCMNCNN